MIDDVDVINEEGTGVDIFQTPTIAVPEFQPDAHQAKIISVESGHSTEKGTPYLQINYVSVNNPMVEGNVKVWIPKAYEESGFSAKFDPTTMASGQQTSYRMSIASSDKRATLQQLVFNPDSIARKAGRDPVELGLKAATDLETYASNINQMLQGVDCIILRRARGGDDPQFANNPEVKTFLAPDAIETKAKLLSKYRLAWLD